MYSRLFKRALDFVGSLLLLIILSPLLFFASFWLFFTLNGSVIFVQKRAGYHGHEFKLYKFKTMNDKRDASGKLLPDEKRLTSFGVFLRKWSIDELPGLINVLRGDISLIVSVRPTTPGINQYL